MKVLEYHPQACRRSGSVLDGVGPDPACAISDRASRRSNRLVIEHRLPGWSALLLDQQPLPPAAHVGAAR